ncbi:MAG: DNA translocase FtsK 4TM domain-containing protein [Deltaproteobacteria bacterium]|nr:DNA translocase FtsK 4TM domain-containing protein [Deltaproteobacteria bacterium]
MQPTLRAQKPAQPIRAILLVMSSIYIALSLISYSQGDPSWNFTASDSVAISNLGGIVGSYLADGLLTLLGVVSYMLTLGALLMGLHYFKIKTILIAENAINHKKPKWQFPVALAIFTICLSGQLSIVPARIYDSISLGGLIGYLVARTGVFCFSPIGATLIFIGGIWVSITMITDRWNFLPSISFGTKWTELKMQAQHNWSGFFSFFKRKRQPEVHKTSTGSALGATRVPSFSLKNSEAETSSEIKEPQVSEAKPVEAKMTEKPAPLLSLFAKAAAPTNESDRVLLMDHVPARKKEAQNYSNFELPSLQLLDLPEVQGFEISKDELIANSRALEQKLLDFGVQGHVTNIRPGPIITLYEFEPAPGVKVKNITNLTDDLKLAMKAVSIRIIAPIPGRAAVGVEIPNPRRQTVYLREVLQSPLFQNSPSPLTMGMGKTTSGEAYVTDLSKMPHLLIAGATGSGKSVGLNGMVVSMLFKASPEELKFIMIDPKMLELSVYEGIPHLLLPVVTDPKKAARALAWAVKEMERRYKLISSLGARNLKSFNEKVERLTEDELKKELMRTAETEASSSAIIADEENEASAQQELALQAAGLDHYVKLPNIVVVIDELADLIMVAARDVEESIARLAQMARAAGIHLIIATQRPSVDVITGVIKANLPTRCAFQVASKVDSRTIIDGSGAENLIGDGDMLFLPPGTSRLERLHGPFISEDEIARVVRHLRSQADADYSTMINLEENSAAPGEAGEGEDIDDELYDQALTVVFETKSPSASMIQRRLRVGYNRAARMIERMEREGIISAPLAGGKGRELLITPSHES